MNKIFLLQFFFAKSLIFRFFFHTNNFCKNNFLLIILNDLIFNRISIKVHRNCGYLIRSLQLKKCPSPQILLKKKKGKKIKRYFGAMQFSGVSNSFLFFFSLYLSTITYS